MEWLKNVDWIAVWTGIAAACIWVAAAIRKVLAGGPPFTLAKIWKEIFSFN